MVPDLETLEQQAVDAAINLNWHDAIVLNKKIVNRQKNNLQAYLRLGFAYIQTSKYEDAKKAYKKSLKIQSNNMLAKQNLERIKILESRGSRKVLKKEIKLDPNLFLEVTGKTKSVSLVKLGQKNILALLTVGQEVFLKPKKRKIEVRTKTNEYIGSLPDDLSKTLFLFTKAGNLYSSFIKEISLNRAVVFIREEKKGKKYAKYSSFPKNIQSDIARIQNEEESPEEEDEVAENELENLAENLSTSEEKDFLVYKEDFEDEENREE